MKKKEFEALGKQLLPYLPGFAIKGPMVFISPIGDTLRGIYFDRSDFNALRFYVEVFFLPIFVPTELVHFTYGMRLGGPGFRWLSDDPNLISELVQRLRNEAMPFFDTVRDMQGVADVMRTMVAPNERGYINPHCQEAYAYTLIKLGETSAGMMAVEKLESILDPSVEWNNTIKARTQLIRRKLLEGQQAIAAQLETWKHETISKLGLKEFC